MLIVCDKNADHLPLTYVLKIWKYKTEKVRKLTINCLLESYKKYQV